MQVGSHMANDVFTKLSRVLETHECGDDDEAFDRMVAEIAPSYDARGKKSNSSSGNNNNNNNTASPRNPKDAVVTLPDRPTPFEVWQAKQMNSAASASPAKETPKLSHQQLDSMIQKMNRNNRAKQDEVVRVQNEGLKQELGGYEFKPRINKTSQDLSKTMKPLQERLKDMMEEKEKTLAKKREDRSKEEIAHCSFVPERAGAKVSDKYLKKMGRSAKARPEDFFEYQNEKIRRNEQRKQIIDEVEAREMIFKPQLPETSRKLHESMAEKNNTTYDPVSKTTTVNRQVIKGIDEANLEEGPALTLESEHPYKNNLNEYTTISIPGAVYYTVSFSDSTSTEPVHDYVRFLQVHDKSIVLGCGKYTGGLADKNGRPSTCNWPGTGSRPPLIIRESKFVVHFKTNNAVVDWGFSMTIIPFIDANAAKANSESKQFAPEISARGTRYGAASRSPNIHDRLYKEGVERQASLHNAHVEVLSTKLNITKMPWETERTPGSAAPKKWAESKTSKGKSLLGPMLNELLVPAGCVPTVAPVEFDDAYASIWKALRNSALLQE